MLNQLPLEFRCFLKIVLIETEIGGILLVHKGNGNSLHVCERLCAVLGDIDTEGQFQHIGHLTVLIELIDGSLNSG